MAGPPCREREAGGAPVEWSARRCDAARSVRRKESESRANLAGVSVKPTRNVGYGRPSRRAIAGHRQSAQRPAPAWGPPVKPSWSPLRATLSTPLSSRSPSRPFRPEGSGDSEGIRLQHRAGRRLLMIPPLEGASSWSSPLWVAATSRGHAGHRVPERRGFRLTLKGCRSGFKVEVETHVLRAEGPD